MCHVNCSYSPNDDFSLTFSSMRWSSHPPLKSFKFCFHSIERKGRTQTNGNQISPLQFEDEPLQPWIENDLGSLHMLSLPGMRNAFICVVDEGHVTPPQSTCDFWVFPFNQASFAKPAAAWWQHWMPHFNGCYGMIPNYDQTRSLTPEFAFIDMIWVLLCHS